MAKKPKRVRYTVGNKGERRAIARKVEEAPIEGMELAVIYTRVSTEEQVREGMSLEAQQQACREYCEREGYQVAKVFVEQGESAKTADRTKLKELLMFCREQKNISVVVVHKLDRFARNTQDHMQLRGVLAAMGVTLRSATEPTDDTSPGRFMETIFAAVAQFDNDIRADRSSNGMRQKLENGYWTFPPPLGYIAGKDRQGNKSIVLDPERAELVRWAFERFSTGLHTRQQVLREVTIRGLRTKKGRPVSSQTFEQTLRKPVYAGRVVIPDWEIDVDGQHEAIVSREVFDKVQMVLEGIRPSITPRSRNNEKFPLRQLVRCGECGEHLTGSDSTSKTGRKYSYYHCQNKCTTVPKLEFESQFIELLTRLQPNPKYMRLYRAVVHDIWKSRQSDVEARKSALSRKLIALKEKRDKLEQRFIFDEAIDRDTYNRLRTDLLSEVTLTEMEIRDSNSDGLEIEAALDYAENMLVNASNFWKAAPLAQKQRFQQVLFPEGIEYANSGYRTTATCLLFNGLDEEQVGKEDLVALPGIEPGF